MNIRLPKLGEGADSGSVVNIFVSEGESIKKDQDILELENEKAIAPIPSTAAGKITKIHVKVGDKIQVGQVLISIKEKEGTASQAAEDISQKTSMPAPRYAGGGRLSKVASQSVGRPSDNPIDFSKWGPIQTKPLSSIRRVIARRMTESWQTIPHVTQHADADVTALLQLIKSHADEFKKKGAHLTLTAVALNILAGVLKKNPIINSSLDEVAGQIVYKQYIHIGVAVDTPKGLMVPVVRDVDKKELLSLSTELSVLAEKARNYKLSPGDMSGGTFTISNLGGIGGTYFTPIINPPEAAVFGIGRGIIRPVIKDNKIQMRTLLPLSLSYDHRLIDGADGARFMMDVVRAFEAFSL